MIVVVDYKKGNIKSVERALARAGADVIVSDKPEDLERAQGIVLPGVGAFADAMESLNASGLTPVLRTQVQGGKPFLGICLGLHLMYEAGVEHAPEGKDVEGLGFLHGTVLSLPKIDEAGNTYKIPHVGWNTIEPASVGGSSFANPILAGIQPDEYFYFTHGYAAPRSEADVAHTTHSVTFPSIVAQGNAFGVQFHPEKSSDAGARMIQNFVNFVKEVG